MLIIVNVNTSVLFSDSDVLNKKGRDWDFWKKERNPRKRGYRLKRNEKGYRKLSLFISIFGYKEVVHKM